MNSIGGFREKEINGIPYYIHTLLSQTDNPSSGKIVTGSGGKDFPQPQPLFFCPSLRLKIEGTTRKHNGHYNVDSILPFDTPPTFGEVRSTAKNFCKVPVVSLFWCNNKEPSFDGFCCGVCRNKKLGTDYYFCPTCCEMFHKECVESPLEIKQHPSYPFLSLQLYSLSDDSWDCICCETGVHGVIYYSPTYKLSMHPVCVLKPIPIFINHLKRHLHPLSYFPKQATLPCNICGLVKEFIPTYVCVRCVFVVHQDCIYFPSVIRISRHQHRISFASSLPFGKWSCGVCRQKVDSNCGAYSCNKCSDYFVHPRCATRRDLWDGEELEGVPEEIEIVVEPFEIIADGIILHFSHGHRLKVETSKVYDDNKLCQACLLPIYEGNYYSCMDECDFILHDECANAPRRKYHPLHPHPLTLKVVTKEYDNYTSYFRCSACGRRCCGFVYESPIEYPGFRLDLRCASVFEPFEYQGHEHPLFLALKPEELQAAKCQICQVESGYYNCMKLNCIECNYIICFRCATLPYMARYKHDKHFLTFYDEKEANDHSDWCDLCERKITHSSHTGFYSCDDCCTTLHIKCLLGDLYMKPGHTIKLSLEAARILPNNTLSRPFCRNCKQRCRYKVVFKYLGGTYCSLICLHL